MSQTTLDDVFIHFANEQSEEVGIMRGAAPTDANEQSEEGIMRGAAPTDEILPDLVPLGPIEQASETMDDEQQATQL